MVKRSPSPSSLRIYPLITTKERLAIWEKARGLWKGRVPDPIREPKKINYSDIPEVSIGSYPPFAGSVAPRSVTKRETYRDLSGRKGSGMAAQDPLKKEVCPID